MTNRSDEELRAFGMAVRRRRTKLGLSQEELAERANLHRTYVGAVERGERNVSLRNVHALARALKIPASRLLLDADHLHPEKPYE